ncbi:MAG: GNAT family N-acetyltransferase [Lachnospiraceae bacterium]|nr:GNAT family N-acetyltransferase [Lachnospiraceae bacterium]
MKLIETKNREKYAKWFESCEDACIISALSGSNGDVYTDDYDKPTVLFAVVSDYVFLTGNSDSINAEHAVKFIDSLFNDGFNIRCIEKGFEQVVKKILKDRVYEYSRFAMERTFEYMDFDLLEENVNSKKEEYAFALIDEELFTYCKENDWAENFVVSYDTYEQWENGGLGVMILKDGDPVAGASSYSNFPGGIEIEIVTRSDYREKGLATAAGSALILECKKRNLVASWDAAHEKSMKLAMKLGYKLLYPYTIIGVNSQK